MYSSNLTKIIDFIGRLLIVVLFISSFYSKVKPGGFNANLEGAIQHGIPLMPYLLYIATAIELIAPILLLIGGRFASLGALLLFLFTIPATYYYHNFWVPGHEDQITNFYKNLGVMGGLLVIFAQHIHECIICGRFCSHRTTSH